MRKAVSKLPAEGKPPTVSRERVKTVEAIPRGHRSETTDADMLARLKVAAALDEGDINLNDPDAPRVLDWSGAVRGRFYKPVKRLKSFRIDADVLAYFEGQGKGYQTTVNDVLRAEMIRRLGRQTAPRSRKGGAG